MSAIAGLISRRDLDGQVGAAEARALLAALNYVVADREATWLGEHCALVVRQLDTSVRERSAPLLVPTANGSLVLMDGSLFNQPELAPDLALPLSISNAELIAAAWEKWGDGFPAKLNGEFALAVWHPKTKRLLLATDHLGTVPLYYANRVDGRLAFSTELQPIIQTTGLPVRPDWTKIADKLTDTLMELDRTFIAGISAVPPGTSMVFSPASSTLRRYWDFTTLNPPVINNEEEGLHRFGGTLARAVARRLSDTDAPSGAHLTGGLDSSLVCALAAHHLGPQMNSLHLFSIVARPTDTDGPEPPQGDAGFIPDFLRMYPHCPHTYLTGRLGMYLPAGGQPNGPVNLQLGGAMEDLVAKAKAAGCRVMLSGYGGELGVTYPGSGIAASALRRRHWRWLWREMMETPATWRKRLQWCRRHLFESNRHTLRKVAARRWDVLREALQPEFIRTHNIEERCKHLPDIADPLLLGQTQVLSNIWRQDRLKDWAYQGRRDGFRYRYPLLDRELLEVIRRLPPTVFMNRGRRRELMRHAGTGILPASIVNRRDKRSVIVSAADRREAVMARRNEPQPYLESMKAFARRLPLSDSGILFDQQQTVCPHEVIATHNIIAIALFINSLPNPI